MAAPHRKILVANWKMHFTRQEAEALTQDLRDRLDDIPLPVVLCVPFPYLEGVGRWINASTQLSLGAQNVHHVRQGAYTGEVSAMMLHSVGAHYVLVGHSERRQFYGEVEPLLVEKMRRALDAGLRPIYCFGESLLDRQNNKTLSVIEAQLAGAPMQLSTEGFQRCILAYEPVWAIGTGVNASAEEAQDVHRAVRRMLANHFGEPVAARVPILYGGSVKPSNAADLFSGPDIDGGLIGGASLNAADFCAIAKHLIAV